MGATVVGHCVVKSDDGVTTGRVSLVDERDGRSEWQRLTDAQRLSINREEISIFGARVRITAVLRAVAHFIKEPRRGG